MNIIKDSRHGPIIFSNKDEFIGKSFDLYGEFSYYEVDFLKSLVEPGDVVIDVGANIGGITIPLAQKIGSSGYMVAFEPQQYIYYSLCGNVAINDLTNTACFQRLVSNIDGEIRNLPIFDYEKQGNFGNNSTRFADENEEKECSPVSTCTIDSLRLSHLNLIKADVEGEELDVLEGASETIKKSRPFLYVEAEGKEASQKIINFVSQFNYNFFYHYPPLFNENNFLGNKHNEFETICEEEKIIETLVSFNIFAYPEEKNEWDENEIPYLTKNEWDENEIPHLTK